MGCIVKQFVDICLTVSDVNQKSIRGLFLEISGCVQGEKPFLAFFFINGFVLSLMLFAIVFLRSYPGLLMDNAERNFFWGKGHGSVNQHTPELLIRTD